jgi:diguanylate cyclase (GGDEF)-like protein
VGATVNADAPSADTRSVDWVDFFDGAISGEQLRVGLTVAAIALVIAVVALVTLVVPHGAPVRWAELGWSLAAVGSAGVYVAVQVHQGRRRPQLVIRPATVLTLVLACIAAVALLNVAGDARGTTYLPMFVEVPVFVAMIGNAPMRRLALVATVGATVATVLVVTPHHQPVPWATIVVGSAVSVILDAMVTAVMTSVRGRNAARGAVNHLMAAAAEAEELDQGLAACLPLVDTVVPANGAAIALRPTDGQPPVVVAAWASDLGGDPMAAWAHRLSLAEDDPDLARALGATTTVVAGRWCGMPVGYGPDGELVLVVDRRRVAGYASRFAQESADALATCFLRLTSRLGHLDRLRQASVTDPLTGLANRRQLLDRLQVELARSRRTGEPLTVAMLDLDHFKELNDSLGHLAGDHLLRAVGAAVASRMRTQDLACRYGGDELCLVLPATDTTGAHRLLEDVRVEVARIGAGTGTGPKTALTGVTVSAGAAVWDGTEAAEALVARADAALLQAKRSGRDRVALDTAVAPQVR